MQKYEEIYKALVNATITYECLYRLADLAHAKHVHAGGLYEHANAAYDKVAELAFDLQTAFLQEGHALSNFTQVSVEIEANAAKQVKRIML